MHKIILFITLLLYTIVVSQPIMYALALKHAQLALDAGSYIKLRQLIDAAMQRHFSYVMYAALLSSLALVVVSYRQPGHLPLAISVLAFLTLLIDALLTLKGSLPINSIINTWTPTEYPADWIEVRARWFAVFAWRQAATWVGFISLLAGTVFRMSK